MSTSLLSDWTHVVIDLPNAPASSDLTLSFSALSNPEYSWGALASWNIARTDLPGSSNVVTVGLKATSLLHDIGSGTIGFVRVKGDVGGEMEVLSYEEHVFSPEPFPEPVVELAITLRSDGAVTFLLNGVSGGVQIPPVPEMFTGARTVTLQSAPYVNGQRRNRINELDSFSISSGGAGNARFWTNFVQSFEVP